MMTIKDAFKQICIHSSSIEFFPSENNIKHVRAEFAYFSIDVIEYFMSNKEMTVNALKFTEQYFKKELKVTLRKGKDIKEEYLPIEKLRESVLIETDNEHVKSSFYDDYSLLYVVVKIKNLDRISVLCRDNKVAVEIICEKLPENIINSFEATRVICQKLI